MKKILYNIVLYISVSTNLYAQAPPSQPSSGPGGNNYFHVSYDSTFYGNNMFDMYWLFEPASPTPDSAAVVFLWHGTTPMTMTDSMDVVHMHEGLIRHLVKKGYTVVYPMYQYGPNMITGGQNAQRDTCAQIVKDALLELHSGAHVIPKRDAQGQLMIATCGHSRGGNLSTSLSANYWQLGLPKFKAVCANVGFDADAPLDSIPPETKWLSIIADNDVNLPNLVTEDTLIDRYCKLISIQSGNKHLLKINSDSTGGIPITADHHYYEAEIGVAGSINVLDFYGGWKLTTGLFDCAFFDTNCEYALSNSDSITYMGHWGNGNEFEQITILDSICNSQTNISVLEKSFGNSFEIYPNPSTGNITIDLNESYKDVLITIRDVNGREVMKKNYDYFNVVEIDIHADAGVYFIEIRMENKFEVVKMIRK